MSRKVRGAVVLLAVLVAGCAAGTGGVANGDSDLLDQEPRRELTVEVKNLNFYDAELYLTDTVQRTRLGFVGGNSTQTFEFRWSSPRTLRIEIHLVSVGTYFSDALPVEEGDELELVIEPDLHRQRPSRPR